MQVIKVLLPKLWLFPLDYHTDLEHTVGELVIVPFRQSQVTGVVWQLNCEAIDKKLRVVIGKLNIGHILSKEMIQLVDYASNYYLSALGTTLKLVLPVDMQDMLRPKPLKKTAKANNRPTIIDKKPSDKRFAWPEQVIDPQKVIELVPEQQLCLRQIENSAVPVLIRGVTGSGKTEIYFSAVLDQLRQGRQVLIMLPEIALTEQMISRFTQRVGFVPVVWNSHVAKSRKKKILYNVMNGKIRVMLGARSALFLPYQSLGLIVVDEEHDTSYKQNNGMTYNARDMAVLRGKIEGCKVILVSATPSIESIYNVQIGKYQSVELNHRFGAAVLPKIEVIDMKCEKLAKNHWLSSRVYQAIRSNLEKKEQTLIFLNRRGYAPLLLCKLCGYKATCNSCSAALVVHKEKNRLECHHCGCLSRIHTQCIKCAGELVLCGPGIERIAEEIKQQFAEQNIAIISKDISDNIGEVGNLLTKIETGEIDIIIGTQVIAKGYHFPKLTLVVIVDADVGFMRADLRAAERTFQLLYQVSGRAGREAIAGKVILQTYLPDHRLIRAFVQNQEFEFLQAELLARKTERMPPFTKLATITFAGKDIDLTKQIAKLFLAHAPNYVPKPDQKKQESITNSSKGISNNRMLSCKKLVPEAVGTINTTNTSEDLCILGPAATIIHKLSGKYRYQILIIADKKFNLQKYIQLWLERVKVPSYCHVKIDIDPQNLL